MLSHECLRVYYNMATYFAISNGVMARVDEEVTLASLYADLNQRKQIIWATYSLARAPLGHGVSTSASTSSKP